jgi:hypothetical protein
MKFWDSSAIVPLLVYEPESERRESQLDESGSLFVWWGTRVECVSALQRRLREGGLKPAEFGRGRKRLMTLAEEWFEVIPGEMVRERAERLLGAHSLRAADSLQLAAALVACSERTVGSVFHTSDSRLGSAAEAEGFAVE